MMIAELNTAMGATSVTILDVGIVITAIGAIILGMNQMDDFFDRRKTKEGNPSNEQLQSSHDELTKRVDKIENDIPKIWDKLNSENTKIRQEMNKQFNDVERALGRIEGKIDNIRLVVAREEKND